MLNDVPPNGWSSVLLLKMSLLFSMMFCSQILKDLNNAKLIGQEFNIIKIPLGKKNQPHAQHS